MNRVLTQALSPQTELRVGAFSRAGGVAPTASLPPTRAARPARSRGVFFGGSGERGTVRGAVSLLCVAVTALSLVTLAPRVIDEPAVAANPAFEIVATSVQLPAAVCSPQQN